MRVEFAADFSALDARSTPPSSRADTRVILPVTDMRYPYAGPWAAQYLFDEESYVMDRPELTASAA